jgi:hypothetical protein
MGHSKKCSGKLFTISGLQFIEQKEKVDLAVSQLNDVNIASQLIPSLVK